MDASHNAGHDSNAAAGAYDQRQEHPPIAPQPLVREIGIPADFPVDQLPPVLAGAVTAIVDYVKCPASLAAGSVIAAASLSVMGHANVIHPATGRRVPLALYLLEVAESGERKSEADRYATEAIRTRVAELEEELAHELQDYKRRRDAYDIAHRSVTNAYAKSTDQAQIAKALEELGDPPKPPKTVNMLVSEPTLEGIQRELAGNRGILGLFSDDGGSFIGGHAMRGEAKLATLVGLSKLWDGAPIDRARAQERIYLRDRRLAVHLAAQPEVALLLIGDPVAQSQGFLPRFLVAYPLSTKGSRLHTAPLPGSEMALAKYNNRLARILETPLPVKPDGEPALRDLSLTDDACAAWITFSDGVEVMLAPDGLMRPISAFASKLGEQVLRIAGIITLFEDIRAETIGIGAIHRAAAIADFYATELLRIADISVIPAEIKAAQELLAWLQQRGEPLFSLRTVYQNGPRKFRTKEPAQSAVRVLIDHGWAVEVVGPIQVDGKKVKSAYRLVDA